MWKSNFKPLKALDRENDFELEEIEKEIHQEKNENEIFIGGALSLKQNSGAQQNEVSSSYLNRHIEEDEGL